MDPPSPNETTRVRSSGKGVWNIAPQSGAGLKPWLGREEEQLSQGCASGAGGEGTPGAKPEQPLQEVLDRKWTPTRNLLSNPREALRRRVGLLFL